MHGAAAAEGGSMRIYILLLVCGCSGKATTTCRTWPALMAGNKKYRNGRKQIMAGRKVVCEPAGQASRFSF